MTTITRRGNKFTVTNAQLIDPLTQIERYMIAMRKTGTPKVTAYPSTLKNPTAKQAFNELRCATVQGNNPIKLVELDSESMNDYLNAKGKPI